jgi:dTMP kinase
MKDKRSGKFIVLYGINNLGKTTQAKLLVKTLRKEGYKAEYVKYPLYDLAPVGKLINDYLRQGNPYNFSPREFQLLHFINKLNYEAALKNKLKKGTNIVAEDYFGTTIAWGMGAGVEMKLLESFYPFLRGEDMAFLFDGKRFRRSIEKNHKHETNDKLIKKVRKAHLMLGRKYKWHKIDANLPIEELQSVIWKKVSKILK